MEITSLLIAIVVLIGLHGLSHAAVIYDKIAKAGNRPENEAEQALIRATRPPCESVSYKDLRSIKPSDHNLGITAKGFYLHLTNGTCFRTSKDDPTLAQDFPTHLTAFNQMMEWMQEKFDASSKSTFC